MYGIIYNKSYISSQSDIIQNKKNYMNSNYLREYFYSDEQNYEFWADLFSIDYINNNSIFYGNQYQNYWHLDDNLKKLLNKYKNEIQSLYKSHNSVCNNNKKIFQ